MVMRALLIALAVVIAWAGFQTIRAGRLKAEAVALRAENATLEREAAGQTEIAAATEIFHTREVVVREIAAQAETEARNAPDADTPLAPERADRLRSHDLRLCNEFPGLCADPDPAGSGPDAVPPAGPAG